MSWRNLLLLLIFAPSVALGDADVFPGPDYPPEALAKGNQGTAIVAVWFNNSGRVSAVTIRHSSGSTILDAWTLRWIKEHWIASAAMRKKLDGSDLVGPIHYQLERDGHSALDAYRHEMNNAIETKWDRLSVARWRRVTVRVRLTVHSDGSVSTQTLDPPSSSESRKLATSVVLAAVAAEAPFKPFTKEMKKEVAESEGNDGNSFTQEISFDDPYGSN